MKLSDIFKFKLFEGSDKANLKIVNENFEIAEKELAATNKEITDKVTEINDRITELNNLLGGKLDVTKIANNLVTTEEGYALDARMGKVLGDDVKKLNTYLPISLKRIDLREFNSVSGDINKVKINFSGKVKTRQLIGLLIVCGQSGICSPISIAFNGNGDYEEPKSVCVSDNDGVATTTDLSIYISSSFKDSWGNICIVLFGEHKELNITTEYVKI